MPYIESKERLGPKAQEDYSTKYSTQQVPKYHPAATAAGNRSLCIKMFLPSPLQAQFTPLRPVLWSVFFHKSKANPSAPARTPPKPHSMLVRTAAPVATGGAEGVALVLVALECESECAPEVPFALTLGSE